MLVITRRLKESIRILDDIQVKVINIQGKQVRLGIEAPNNVVVNREEIYQKMVAEGKPIYRTQPDEEE